MTTAILFVGIVVIVLVVSIASKVIFTIQRSIFDGQHQFVLLLESPENKAALVGIDPADSKIVVLYIFNSKQDVIQSDMPIGIDASVHANMPVNTLHDVEQQLLENVFFPNSSTNGMTWYDVLRLYFLMKTMNTSDVTESKITLPANETQKTQSLTEFADPTIEKESVPVQIINATDISGKAGRLEAVLTNTGFSVIDVRTNQKVTSSSIIRYYGRISYTVEKLHRILGYPTRQTYTQMIGTIQITIGKDGNRVARF